MHPPDLLSLVINHRCLFCANVCQKHECRSRSNLKLLNKRLGVFKCALFVPTKNIHNQTCNSSRCLSFVEIMDAGIKKTFLQPWKSYINQTLLFLNPFAELTLHLMKMGIHNKKLHCCESSFPNDMYFSRWQLAFKFDFWVDIHFVLWFGELQLAVLQVKHQPLRIHIGTCCHQCLKSALIGRARLLHPENFLCFLFLCHFSFIKNDYFRNSSTKRQTTRKEFETCLAKWKPDGEFAAENVTFPHWHLPAHHHINDAHE